MADLILLSTAVANMPDYPSYLQAVNPDPAISYTAEDTRQDARASYLEGVCGMGDFRVTQRAAGANLTVDIAPGQGVIQGDTSTRQGKFLVDSIGVVNTGTAGNITVPGSGTRTHRVIARARDKQASGTAYGWSFEVLEDTGSGMPALPASAMDLASIAVPSGSSSVTDAMITDRRSYACPQIPLSIQTLAADAATVVFDGIPGFVRALELNWTCRSTAASTAILQARINDDTTASYGQMLRRLIGNNTTSPAQGLAAAAATSAWLGVVPGSIHTAGVFGSGVVKFPKWRSDGVTSRVHMLFSSMYWDTLASTEDDVGSNYWTNTTTPKKITLSMTTGSILAGSQFILTAIC